MRWHQALTLIVTFGLILAAHSMCAAADQSFSRPVSFTPDLRTNPVVYEVMASWYGGSFAGRPTTSGEVFNPHHLTAASLSVPLGSVVKVENPSNGRSVMVRINDCGPYVVGRGLDLSRRAAEKIGIIRQGVARLAVIPISIPPNADVDRCTR